MLCTQSPGSTNGGHFSAGMLPGVECARRRRVYQGGLSSDDTQKRACHLSLYEPFSDRRSASSVMTRPITLHETDQNCNDKLNGVVLEARERLEGRLRASSTVNKRLSHIMLINNRDRYTVGGLVTETRQPSELVRGVQPASVATSKACISLLRKEIYTPETKRGKSWLKLKSRTLEVEDCAVCLDCFKLNQVLIHLPRGHKFHSSCLIPWLDSNQHCPYCRATISP